MHESHRKLAAEFEVELAAEGFDSVKDLLRLKRDVLIVIKTNGIHKFRAFPK